MSLNFLFFLFSGNIELFGSSFFNLMLSFDSFLIFLIELFGFEKKNLFFSLIEYLNIIFYCSN